MRTYSEKQNSILVFQISQRKIPSLFFLLRISVYVPYKYIIVMHFVQTVVPVLSEYIKSRF